MGSLWDQVRAAVAEERYLVSWHADERCEEQGVTEWQLVSGADDAVVVEERLWTQPNPSVVVRQLLTDGSEVEVVWAWMPKSGRAKLVTVYFPD
jgi:hypothetical protein